MKITKEVAEAAKAAEATRISEDTSEETEAEPPVALPATPAAFDDDESHPAFFRKSEAEIHEEHGRIEAPDLHDDIVQARLSRRPPDPRAKRLVAGIVGLFAVIGLIALVRAKTKPTPAPAPSNTAVVTAPTPTIPPPSPYLEHPLESASTTATASVPPVTSSSSAAPPTSVSAAPSASAAPSVSAAPSASAAVDDPDAALSGAQLLANARAALGASPSRAALLARKAIAKGAGGSAFYVLGAAYQTMGANGAAKSAYQSCAKSGAPEAGECASLVESM